MHMLELKRPDIVAAAKPVTQQLLCDRSNNTINCSVFYYQASLRATRLDVLHKNRSLFGSSAERTLRSSFFLYIIIALIM